MHERQGWNQQCAQHCINNMLQKRAAVTKDHLDAIARRLHAAERDLGAAPWLNPNRSALGLGNYSVGVLETAFREHGLDCTQRVSTSSASPVVSDALPVAELGKLEGLVVNRTGSLFGVIKTRHWYAVRRLPAAHATATSGAADAGPEVATREAAGSAEAREGDWYSLDSLQQHPRHIGGAPQLYALLQRELDSGGDVLRVQRVAADETEAVPLASGGATICRGADEQQQNQQPGTSASSES